MMKGLRGQVCQEDGLVQEKESVWEGEMRGFINEGGKGPTTMMMMRHHLPTHEGYGFAKQAGDGGIEPCHLCAY